MKKKLCFVKLVLVVLLMGCLPVSVFGADLRVVSVIDEEKIIKQVLEQQKDKEKLTEEQRFRAIPALTDVAINGVAGVAFSKTAYDPKNNILYLGAQKINPAAVQDPKIPAPKQSSLVLSSLGQSNGAYKPSIVSMALQEGVKLNGAEAKTPAEKEKLLYDKKIEHLAFAGSVLAVVATDFNVDPKLDLNKNVFTVSTLDGGKTLLKNIDPIKDAIGAEVNSKIVALGADTSSRIIAAVSAKDKTWIDADGTNRGFAVLKPTKESNKLDVIEHTNSGIGLGAKHLNLVVDPAGAVATDAYPVAFKGPGVNALTKAQIIVDMNAIPVPVDIHYSAQFNRFFIGLVGVTKPLAEAGFDGGMLSVLVGNIDATTGKLTLKPILDGANAAKLTTANQEVIGFYDAGANHVASAFKVRTMHTSTKTSKVPGGYDYLIVVGGVSDDGSGLDSWVTALPIMPTSDANAGQLAYYHTGDKVFKVITDAAQVKKIDRTKTYKDKANFNYAAVVGVDPTIIGNPGKDNKIQDIMVDGDTVYVVVTKEGNDAYPKGVFASTALFDKNGVINGWTRWQRVGGLNRAIRGFGFNNTTGNFQFLTTEDGLAASIYANTIGSTAWGKSEDVLLDKVYNTLTSDLMTIFPVEKGGVYKIFDFSSQTSSFLSPFSMMVAVGGNTVALIQTNAADANWGIGKNIFVYSGDADLVAKLNALVANSAIYCADLELIGPVTCAEVLRTNEAGNFGHLFVGGFKGVARLQENGAGDGWNSGVGLNALPIKTGVTLFEFVKLDDFDRLSGDDPIFSLVSYKGPAYTSLYLACLKNLLIKDNAKPAGDGIEPRPLIGLATASCYCSDVAVVGRLNVVGDAVDTPAVIAATTNGVLVSIDNFEHFVLVPNISGTPVKLRYISRVKDLVSAAPDQVDLSQGVLYVFTIDREKDTSYVYRFAVNVAAGVAQEDILAPIDIIDGMAVVTAKPFIDYGELRTDFSTDGDIFFNTRYKCVDAYDYLRMRSGSTLLNDEDNSLYLFLGRDGQKADALAHIAAPVRDSFSGMWIVPGEIRING